MQRITPLFDKPEIEERLKRLGETITNDYRGKDLVCICILKGAFIFMADLVRNIQVPLVTEFMQVSSYHGVESTGNLRILLDLRSDISGKHVLIVEDIVDTGLTINRLVDMLQARNPASINICTLLLKGSPETKLPIRYVGFCVRPGDFVIGYGLDLDERYRELTYVGIVTP